jgi:hypothetical protein
MPLMTRSYVDERAGAGFVVAATRFFWIEGIGCGRDGGADRATWERFGDGAFKVDVGDSRDSLCEKTLSATLSSPDSKPESLVKVPWLVRLPPR